MRRSNPVTIELNCGHFIHSAYISHHGARMWCPACDTSRIVVTVLRWTVKCQNCPHTRICGTVTAAEESAARHARKHQHTLHIYNPAMNVITKVTSNSDTMYLFDTDPIEGG